MADTHETTADIIAEMRRIRVREFQDYADRLEAAHKRERGDAAKLREALEFCVKGMCGFCRMDAEARGMTTECVNGCEALRKAKAALSAPPRNCDVPLVVDGPADNNADKAWLVFKQHNPDAYFDVPGLLRCIDWLLAPATEKEGGDK